MTSDKEELSIDAVCHMESYEVREIDYSDLLAVDLIVGRATKTAAHVFKKTGCHRPTFVIFGYVNPFSKMGCESHGWILSAFLPEGSKASFSGFAEWAKGVAAEMSAYCVVSLAEICIDDKTGSEALNVQIEHAMCDKRLIAKFHRNKRNWSLLDWEQLANPDPPVEQLRGILPADPIFANAEEV